MLIWTLILSNNNYIIYKNLTNEGLSVYNNFGSYEIVLTLLPFAVVAIERISAFVWLPNWEMNLKTCNLAFFHK